MQLGPLKLDIAIAPIAAGRSFYSVKYQLPSSLPGNQTSLKQDPGGAGSGQGLFQKSV